MFNTHSLTLKYNSAYLDSLGEKGNTVRNKAYAVWRNKVGQVLDIGPLVEEKDASGRLHLHGTIQVPVAWSFKTLNNHLRMQNMHVYTTLLYNAEGWEEYCKKDQPKEAEIKVFKPDLDWKLKQVEETVKLLKPLPASVCDLF